MRTLAFKLDIDWDELRGETKSAKAEALVDYCRSRARMTDLLEHILKERPNLRRGFFEGSSGTISAE